MANEYIDFVRPRDLIPLNGDVNAGRLVYTGTGGFVRLLRSDTSGFTFRAVLPANLTFTTGVKFQVETTDDGKQAADLGLAIVVGVLVKKIVSGTDTEAGTTAAGTEVTATITQAATTGVAVLTDIAIVNASLDSAGAGDPIEVTVRRIGSNAADTCQGPALLGNVYLRAY